MRKNNIIFLLISALALLSCSKEKGQEPVQAGEMRFAVTVEGSTKASMTSADLNQFYLKVTGPNIAFSFFDSIVKDGETWKASSKKLLWKDEESSITYAAASYGALGADYFNVPVTDDNFVSGAVMGILTDQSTQERLNAADLLTMKETTVAFADTEDGEISIKLKHGLAKVNFAVTFSHVMELTADDIEDVIINGVHRTFTFKPLTGEVTIPTGAPKGAVVPFLSSVEGSKATFESILAPETLAPGALSLYLTVKGKDFQWTNSQELALAQGGEYTIPVTIDYDAVPETPVTPDPDPDPTPGGTEPLSAVFSVSDTKTVTFSPGNLQLTAANTWKFAEHQYDFIGDSQSDNHRDVFGWGTGNNPNQTSSDPNDYGTFTDWGNNTNLQSQLGTGWYTLSTAEWQYLLGTNSTRSGRYGLGKYETVCGLILIPDDVTIPTGFNATCSSFDNNLWSESFTAVGAVFLPAAGRREESGFVEAGEYGGYWSSTPNNSDSEEAYALYFGALYFGDGIVNSNDEGNRNIGRSVRLVKDAATE